MCMAFGVKLPSSTVTATSPYIRCSIQTLAESEKNPEIQRHLQAPYKKIHHRLIPKNPLKNLRIMLELNSYAKITETSSFARLRITDSKEIRHP